MFLKLKSSEKWERFNGIELWEKFKASNRDALSALFLRYYRRLFKYGMSFTSSSEEVKDGIQKLFVRLWEKKDDINTPDSIDAYLFVSLRRILLRKNERKDSRYRRNAKYIESHDDDIISIEEEIILQEDQQTRLVLYKEAVKVLSPRQKEAILLRVDNGMKNGEIAQIMDIYDKRVRNLIYEATKRLKEEIYNLTE